MKRYCWKECKYVVALMQIATDCCSCIHADSARIRNDSVGDDDDDDDDDSRTNGPDHLHTGARAERRRLYA